MYVDLTVDLNEQTPVYPGDPATQIKQANVLNKDGYCDHNISLGSHAGTHIDAPMHMLEAGVSLDRIPVDQFIGNGQIVKVTDGDFGVVKTANIKAGDIVLFHTGMSDKFYEPSYFEDYPAMSEDIARYLVEARVKMVGLDTCSADNKHGFLIHKILLGGGVLIIENLTNLDRLYGKDFNVYALPIKLQIDGAPARVVAEIKA